MEFRDYSDNKNSENQLFSYLESTISELFDTSENDSIDSGSQLYEHTAELAPQLDTDNINELDLIEFLNLEAHDEEEQSIPKKDEQNSAIYNEISSTGSYEDCASLDTSKDVEPTSVTNNEIQKKVERECNKIYRDMISRIQSSLKFKKRTQKEIDQPYCCNATENQKNVLENWAKQHLDHPYPSKLEILNLMRKTNLTDNEIQNYFKNRRYRGPYSGNSPVSDSTYLIDNYIKKKLRTK